MKASAHEEFGPPLDDTRENNSISPSTITVATSCRGLRACGTRSLPVKNVMRRARD
jgi:hypothetical protein